MNKYFIVFSLIPFYLMGQTEEPKTIFELFQIDTNSCIPINIKPKKKVSEIIYEMVSSESEPIKWNPIDTINPYNLLINQLKSPIVDRYFKEVKALDNRKINLVSGNYCFRKKKKWSLKSKVGKTLIRPKFSYIFPDTINDGFVGYIGDQCNYYDGLSGKPLFKKNYFHIKPASANTFLVKTKNGWGIINRNNKILVPTENESIDYVAQSKFYKGIPYFEVSPYYPKSYIYIENQYRTKKDSFAIAQNGHTRFPEIINTKNLKPLVCNQNKVEFSIINEETRLITVWKKDNKEETYLADFEGNLINNQIYRSLHVVTFERGRYATAVTKDINNQRKSGIVNSKGEWVIPPNYRDIYPLNYKAYNFGLGKNDSIFIATNEQEEEGLLNKKEEILIPFAKQQIIPITDNLIYLRHKEDKQENIFVGNIFQYHPTTRIIKSNLPYKSIEALNACNQKYFVGRFRIMSREFSVLLNKNFDPVKTQYHWSEEDYEKITKVTEHVGFQSNDSLYLVKGKKNRQDLISKNMGMMMSLSNKEQPIPINDSLLYIKIVEKGQFLDSFYLGRVIHTIPTPYRVELNHLKYALPYSKIKTYHDEYFIGELALNEDNFGIILNKDFDFAETKYHSYIRDAGETFKGYFGFRKREVPYGCNGYPLKVSLLNKEISNYLSYKKIDNHLSTLIDSEKKYFLIQANGTYVEDTIQWKKISPFGIKGLYIGTNRYRQGVLNDKGQIIIPPIFHDIKAFGDDGLAAFKIDKEHQGYFTLKGNIIFEGKYSFVEKIGFDLFDVKKNGKSGIVNRQNEVIVPLEFDNTWLDGSLIYTFDTKSSMIKFFTISGKFIGSLIYE